LNKPKTIALLLCCLLSALTVGLQAQTTPATNDKEWLTQEMYRLYGTDSTARFMEVTEQLKDLCLSVGDEHLFYRAWANQVTQTYSHNGRVEAQAIFEAMQDYALKSDSKFGIYTSTQTNAYILSSSGMLDQAEKAYLEIIDYHDRYYPDESIAFAYMGLCKVYQNRKENQKIILYASKAANDPKTLPSARRIALSYICIAHADEIRKGISIEENTRKFKEAYAEYKKVAPADADMKSADIFVEFYNAKVDSVPDSMIYWANRIRSVTTRLSFLASAYQRKSDYRQAYYTMVDLKSVQDSLYRLESVKKSMENAELLGRLHAENEAKDLRLANQSLLLSHIHDELEQRRLEEEALNLMLKHREAELHSAAILMENDSLDRYNKDLQLREYQSQLEVQQGKEKIERIMLRSTIGGGLLIIAFLAFYLYRRSRHMKKLATAYSELEHTYEQLKQTTEAKERIEGELLVARDIQMSMVPHTFPDRPGLDLYAEMTPAKEVGGDLYDFTLHGDLLYLCVGDVAGKGVPASLFMAQAVRLFHALVLQQLSPREIANRLNIDLSENNDNGMFVTMFIGCADLQTGHFSFCNAGHNPPVIGGSDQGGTFIPVESNAPIGLWPKMDFVGEEIDNIKGRPLFIYTDGLNEAENPQQEQLGDERLLDIVRHVRFHNARQTIEHIHAEVERHRQGAEPNDDLTMMCLRLN